ncbi:MAG: sugar ABC transporter permease [Hyphomicrobiales bacterium]|jgi:multiple sugar transport system permease protein|nr:sugar ABC transporter permease [Hyphomicrobiales bacterium]
MRTSSAHVLAGYHWMAAPAMVFTIGMIGFPIGYAIWLSLSNVPPGGTPVFIGLDNYARLVKDPEFWNAFKLTVSLYVMSLSMQLVLGTWLGLLLGRSRAAQGLTRVILVSPFMLPPVVVGMMAIVILDPSFGIANWLLAQIGLPPGLWLSDPRTVLFTFAVLDTWQWTPFVALIVMGGYLSLPGEVFEAVELDGATSFQRFWHVTLPLLGPTLVTAAVLRSVDILRFFDVIYLTTQGGPGNSSTTLNILAYRRGFEFFDFGYASAIMITLSAVVLGSVLIFSKLRAAVAW